MCVRLDRHRIFGIVSNPYLCMFILYAKSLHPTPVHNSTRLFYPNTSHFPPSYICLHILLRPPLRLYIRLLLVTMLFLVRKKWEISHKPKLTRHCSTLQADGVIISRQIHLSSMKFLLPTPIHFLQKNKFSWFHFNVAKISAFYVRSMRFSS